MKLIIFLLYFNGSCWFLACTISGNPKLGFVAACFFTLGSFLSLVDYTWEQYRYRRTWARWVEHSKEILNEEAVMPKITDRDYNDA